MKLSDILEQITSNEQEQFGKNHTRRESILQLGKLGKNLALSAIPLGVFSAISTSAKAGNSGSNVTMVEALQFALTLEYLERGFYQQGIDSTFLAAQMSTGERAVFQQILEHEKDHVTFLRATLIQLAGSGSVPSTDPVFDYTGNNQFNPFTVYADFLALAQAFEDTGVRAYKGQAANLMDTSSKTNAVLTAALQIHSVEARHAAEVRKIRGNKGWITGTDADGLPAAIYAGEGNTMQGTVNVSSVSTVGNDAITEAFDEALDKDAVMAIVQPFL